MRGLWRAALGLALSGCSTYSLQELRSTEPQGNAFQQALAREYLHYATQEEQNYDWADSWHFADKGLTAAYGNDVGPEEISNWSVTPEVAQELEAARDALLTALTPAVVEAQPLQAARAYMQFDCWVERAEDGWENAKIAQCKEGFLDTLSGLTPGSSLSVATSVDTTSYLVFFEWNSAALNAPGKRVVEDVVTSLASETQYDIVLNGHTDSTGLEKFNLTLSKKRAEAVLRELVASGIAKERIKIFAFGESDPRVPTADGMDEPQNRRVEIFIQ